MIKMRFDEYDKMIEDFKKIDTNTMWPTLSQIEKMEDEPERWMTFLCYLLEKGKKPENKDEEYRKKTVRQFVNSNLELVDASEIVSDIIAFISEKDLELIKNAKANEEMRDLLKKRIQKVIRDKMVDNAELVTMGEVMCYIVNN